MAHSVAESADNLILSSATWASRRLRRSWPKGAGEASTEICEMQKNACWSWNEVLRTSCCTILVSTDFYNQNVHLMFCSLPCSFSEDDLSTFYFRKVISGLITIFWTTKYKTQRVFHSQSSAVWLYKFHTWNQERTCMWFIPEQLAKYTDCNSMKIRKNQSNTYFQLNLGWNVRG